MILLGLSGVYPLHIIIGYLFPGCLKVTVLYLLTSHLTFLVCWRDNVFLDIKVNRIDKLSVSCWPSVCHSYLQTYLASTSNSLINWKGICQHFRNVILQNKYCNDLLLNIFLSKHWTNSYDESAPGQIQNKINFQFE